jgi:hypothetical protein
MAATLTTLGRRSAQTALTWEEICEHGPWRHFRGYYRALEGIQSGLPSGGPSYSFFIVYYSVN